MQRRRASFKQGQADGEEQDIAFAVDGERGVPKVQRKAVPVVEWASSQGEVIVVQAGNIMMEQAHMQAEREQSMERMGSRALLPSPSLIQGRIAREDDLGMTERGRDQSLAGHHQAVIHAWQDILEEDQTDDGVARTPKSIEKDLHSDLATSASATSTLQDINRSLQWSLKLPYGRHLSRAKSRTTIGSFNEGRDQINATRDSHNLAEARAGLRLLSRKREDVLAEKNTHSSRIATWNTFKISLFISVVLVFAMALFGLVVSLLTWARAWKGAQVSIVVDMDIIILTTVASGLCLATSMVGLSGTMLNSRPILALYAFLLWPSLLAILVVGYTSYKRANLRLDLKLNQTWSRYMDDLGRLRVQEFLQCCGYYSPLHQATFSRYCYPRTTLPGCKGPLYRFEKGSLSTAYSATFSIVFVHLAAIAASILCSNQVNVTFGKGLTPKAYRLDMGHVRRNAVNIIRMLSMETSGSMEAHRYLEVDRPL